MHSVRSSDFYVLLLYNDEMDSITDEIDSNEIKRTMIMRITKPLFFSSYL